MNTLLRLKAPGFWASKIRLGALLFSASLLGLTPSCGQAPSADAEAQDLEGLAVSFIPNAGQTDSSVRFQAQTLGGMVFFKSDEVVLSLPTQASNPNFDERSHPDAIPPQQGWAFVRIRFDGANSNGELSSYSPLPGVANFLMGDREEAWTTNIPTYAGIAYDNLYPGIRLRYEGRNNRLKSTYEVEAGADPNQIRWHYDGALDAQIDAETGSLRLAASAVAIPLESAAYDVLTEHAPIAWQEIEGRRVPVDVHFVKTEEGQFRFSVDDYDTSQPLIIDPAISFSTFVGGRTASAGRGLTVGSDGSAFVTGDTNASSFPTTGGVQDTSFNGGTDVFVTKLTPAGNMLSFSTFLGGTLNDSANDIAIETTTGDILITGVTASTNYPIKSAQQGIKTGAMDAFITRIAPTGASIVFSSFHGGNGDETGHGVGVDSLGNAFITGQTTSTNMPTVGSPAEASLEGISDAFMVKWGPTGARLYSTYLGGSGTETGRAIAVRGSVVAITGDSTSSNTLLIGGYDTIHNGGTDVFVYKFLTSTAFQASTYLGGSADDIGRGIAIDAAGSIYVTGETNSFNFPILNAYDSGANGGKDIFITKLGPNINALSFSTYLGGSADDVGRDIAVDANNNVYITGATQSLNLPTPTGFDSTANGMGDAVVAKLAAAGNGLFYLGYLGGSALDEGNSIAVDSLGNAYVTGSTSSSIGFPLINAYDTNQNGSTDAFVTKIASNGGGFNYSTYLGGGSTDIANSIAVQSGLNGSVYITGTTTANGFPTAGSPVDLSYDGLTDSFVTKLNSQGNAPLYSTYLGGSGQDTAVAIAVDGVGYAYVTGSTDSLNFPSKNAPAAISGSGTDAFAVKLLPNGDGFDLSAKLGGNSADNGRGIATDGMGNLFIVGQTLSSNFPLFNPLQGMVFGSYDSFITKLHPNTLDFSTKLGGTGMDMGYGIDVDTMGNIYVTGITYSADFPATANPICTFNKGSPGGFSDAFAAKIDVAASMFVYSTFLGGSSNDAGLDIAVDNTGNAYITGGTTSADFEVTNALQGMLMGGSDAFLSKIDASGLWMHYSTYHGGSGNDQGNAIAVHRTFEIPYITGQTYSMNFPMALPAQSNWGGQMNGLADAFVTKFEPDPINGIAYSTYLGGTGEDIGRGIAIDALNFAWVTGSTKSLDFAATAGAYDTTFNGQTDAFVTKLSN